VAGFLFSFLKNFHGPAVYVGVLFILITCGLGVPLPEDVPLIAGGYLVARSGSLPLMVLTGLAGILIGDSIIFRAGQTYGEKLLETRLGRHVPKIRVQRTVQLFEKHGAKFILVARFVPGLRAVTYFVAGTTGVPYWKFLVFDGLAACVSAPAWVILGWYARKHSMIHRAMRISSHAELALLIIFLCVTAAWLLISSLRRRARRLRGEPSTPPEVTPLRAVDSRRR
jgi:membrane protein DedA with SNARE-associated domain